MSLDTGQRQGGGKYGPQGVKATRKASDKVRKPKVNRHLADKWLELGRRFVTIQIKQGGGAGRPTNVEKDTIEFVERILARENIRLVYKPNVGYIPYAMKAAAAQITDQSAEPTEQQAPETEPAE